MPNNFGLTREQLSKFLPDHQSIRAFEQLIQQATVTNPGTIEQATTVADSALAMATAAISQLVELVSALDQALNQPVPAPVQEDEPFLPNYGAQFGTLAYQNADDVEITGGTLTVSTLSYSGQLTSTVATGTAPFVIASTTKVANLNVDLLDGADWAAPAGIGTTTPNSGAFTSLSYSGQLTSTVATGTAPMVVASTTKVANLNVDLLDGADWAAPAAIGTTTPNTAVFTTLTATGNIDLGSDSAARTMFVRGNASGSGGGVFTAWRNNNANVIVIGNKSAIFVTAYDARPYIYSAANYIEFSNGFMTNGDVGFYGTTPVAKQTVTGSRGGNAALASLLTALANYGIITNSTTA